MQYSDEFRGLDERKAPGHEESPPASSQLRDACEKVIHAHEEIESRDFDLHETAQYIEYVMGLKRGERKLKAVLRWTMLWCIGTATGICAIVIDFSVDVLWYLRLHISADFWLSSPFVRYLAHVIPAVGYAALAAGFVCFEEPLAGGSGLPEVKGYLNGVDQPGLLDGSVLVGRGAGIICSVSSGLPCGKEGPMVHIGACIAGLLSKFGMGRMLQKHRADTEVRDMVAAGAAAGVAAAFSAPVGAVLFIIEEGASFFNAELILHAFVCCTAATVVTHFYFSGMQCSDLLDAEPLLRRGQSCNWGDMRATAPMSFGGNIGSQSGGSVGYKIWELPLFALLGVMGGLLGALFNAANREISRWRARLIGPRGFRRFCEALVVTLCVSSMQYVLSLGEHGYHFASNGHFHDVERFWFASLFRSLGTHSVQGLFTKPSGEYQKGALVEFGVMNFILSYVTYGLGVPSGLFVPSLLTGAAFGRCFGEFLGSPLSPPGVYALIGATAVLSGVARITISLAVILIEASGSTEWALPIFITTMVAKWTGDFFTIGLYDIHLKLKKVPILELRADRETITIQAREVMATNVVNLQVVEPVQRVLETLYGCNHHGFPVLGPAGNFFGLIRRSTLLQVLSKGGACGLFQDADGELRIPAPTMPYEDSVSTTVSLGEVRRGLSRNDLDCRVDLTPFVNRGCYTVPEHAALMRVHMLFRNMGLRYLPVVSHDGSVSGIITRKDLVRAQERVEAEEAAALEPGEATMAQVAAPGHWWASGFPEEATPGQPQAYHPHLGPDTVGIPTLGA